MSDYDLDCQIAEKEARECEEYAAQLAAESDAAAALAEQEAIQFAEAQAEAQAEEEFFKKKSRYIITEEPIDSAGVQEVLARQDEPTHITKSRNYVVRRKEVRLAEADLFLMKAQLARMRPIPGKITIPAPSPYRCDLCGNTDCLNHGLLPCREKTIIANQTAMNGCLEFRIVIS
jgi:multidrug resistance efflux pump